MNSKTFIYSLSNRDGEIKYIGKTNNLKKRLFAHIATAKKEGKCHKSKWIRQLLKKDETPVIEILEEVEDTNWKMHEIYWIAQCRAWGYKLTNITKGGDGGDTFTNLTPERKEERNLKLSKALKGVKCNPEWIANLSISKTGNKNPMFGKKPNEDTRRKQMESMRKYYITHNNSNKGITISEDRKQKISKNNAKYWLGKKLPKDMIENMSKRILQYSMTGEFIKEWASISEAERVIGAHSISMVCNNKINFAKNFIWRFKYNDNFEKYINVDFGIRANSKSVLQYSKDGFLIKEWQSMTLAQNELNIKNISRSCHSNTTSGGFIWKFK